MTHQILPSNQACGVATQKSNSALKAIIKPMVIMVSPYRRHNDDMAAWRYFGPRHGDATAPASMASAISAGRRRGADMASCGVHFSCGGRHTG